MSEPLVRVDSDRGVRTLTLDSPANRNALSARLRTELVAAFTAAAGEDDVRAVHLTGTGPVFCAGVDLKEAAAERAGHPPDPDAPTFAELLGTLLTLPKPVVATLNGGARAGGVGLVAAADIAIAPLSATFACTEVRIGVIPAVISAALAARMADRQLSRYLLTGEVFDATEAATAGLLTVAVPDTDVAAETDRVLAALRQCAPTALAGTKRLLSERAFPDLAADLADLGRLSARHFASDDAAEGRAAFFEKRPPRWAVEP